MTQKSQQTLFFGLNTSRLQTRTSRGVLAAVALLVLLTLAAVIPLVVLTKSRTGVKINEKEEQFNYLFSFGDSYSETGFSINGSAPSLGNPMGNPPYPGRTSTSDDGANWVGFLTTKYNNSRFLTYNFAWGGATINRTVLHPGQDISFDDQVRNFTWWNSAHGGSTGWNSSNSLFSSWIGINDILLTYNVPARNHSEFYDQLLDDEFWLVDELISNNGARNWLFVNVPPMDRTPAAAVWGTTANATIEKSIVELFNTKLAAKVEDFKSSRSGVSVWSLDSHAIFTRILDSPKEYGFGDAVSEGPTAIWGNSIHPSSLVHEIIAQEVSKLLSDTPW